MLDDKSLQENASKLLQIKSELEKIKAQLESNPKAEERQVLEKKFWEFYNSFSQALNDLQRANNVKKK